MQSNNKTILIIPFLFQVLPRQRRRHLVHQRQHGRRLGQDRLGLALHRHLSVDTGRSHSPTGQGLLGLKGEGGKSRGIA